MSLPSISDLPAAQRRIIRAWCMYDWANSAFATSLVAIVPVYFVHLFNDSLGESEVFLGITFTGSSMWSLGVALSTAIVAFSSPLIGVIADRAPIRRALLWTYTIIGSFFTLLAFFSAYTPEPWLWVFSMFTIANIGFAGGLVFYNSFLPHLGPRHLLDDISSRGFAYGYAGGGLLLVVHLALILAARGTDFEDLATRIAIASVGFWWFAWAIWTLRVLPEPPVRRPASGLTAASAVTTALRELGQTFRELRRFRVVLVFLAAYLLFNDGVQTVLAIAGAFAADTLGIPLAFNMATIAIIQFVAVPGALAFGWLADRIATKAALIVSLVGWIGIVLFGVALAPLPPGEHADHDFQLSYREASSDYVVEAAPDLDEALRAALGGRVLVPRGGRRPQRRRARQPAGGDTGVRGCRVQPLDPRRGPRRRVRDRPRAPLGAGRGPDRLVAVAGTRRALEPARRRCRLPVAAARRAGGVHHRRQSGARAEPLRADHARTPERRVLRLLRLHRQSVVGARPNDLHRRDGRVRHARRGDLDPADHHRRHDRAEVG